MRMQRAKIINLELKITLLLTSSLQCSRLFFRGEGNKAAALEAS